MPAEFLRAVRDLVRVLCRHFTDSGSPGKAPDWIFTVAEGEGPDTPQTRGELLELSLETTGAISTFDNRLVFFLGDPEGERATFILREAPFLRKVAQRLLVVDELQKALDDSPAVKHFRMLFDNLLLTEWCRKGGVQCDIDRPEADDGGEIRWRVNLLLTLVAIGPHLLKELLKAAKAVDTVARAKGAEARAAPRPVWDKNRREMRYDGRRWKPFNKSAPNQELVLDSFQEQDWADRLDDPLPRGKLADTIRDLQRTFRESPITFERDGTGRGIVWRLR